ncbi:alginate export family protein [Rhodopirellula europaea]|uniref:Putative secreted protein n=1 Tax=Rhodopirellula europaea 6C TaxID=1263867 RepID=M2AL39_9BACT|nr:alginate export family protein [Rhodopirellula europaea]EMB13407.1 putative secreted protein [Rhodopirellula europaea 6C]
MSQRNWKRRLLSAIAIATAAISTHAHAQDTSGLEPVEVLVFQQDSGALTEPGPSPTSSTEEPAASSIVDSQSPIAEPVVDTSTYSDPYASYSAPCTCCANGCCTKKKKEAAMAKMKGAYQGVFYANDFSYLDDPCYDGPSFFGDSLKGMFNGTLDVGGEARVRYHNENNHRGLGITGNDDNFWLTRYRMFANWRLSDNLRFYGEYLYADSGGELFNNRPIEENRGEAQNLFLEAQLTDNLSVRGGRQELLLGAQRLISPLDWANTRRTFDGVRATYANKDGSIDAFYTHPVKRTAAYEDKWDATNQDVQFFGAYMTRKDTWLGQWENYYLGLNNDTTNFDYHTIGSRIVGKTDSNWLYEYEGGTQFGTNSDGTDHSAGFFTGGLGRQVAMTSDWKPTLWFWYDYASGGDDDLRGGDGFDHMFPLAHKYLGFMDLFGRRNIHDINAQFITPFFGEKVKLVLWYHYFMLDEKTTPFNVVMNPSNPGNAAGDRELGHEIDVLFQIALNPRNSALIGYSHFNSGKYYSTTAGVQDLDADFFYFQYQMRF